MKTSTPKPWLKRVLWGGMAIGAVCALVWVVVVVPTFVVGKDLEDRQKDSLTSAELLKAKNDIRSAALQGLAGLFLLSGALLTWRQLRETRDARREEAHLVREGQITERFTRAIDQLGSDALDVRVGGIYALERIARDSETDYGPVMVILATFVREHARAGDPHLEAILGRSTSADVEAAAQVVTRRHNDAVFSPDLTRARLPGASLVNAVLDLAFLLGADLRGADLTSADQPARR